MKKILHILSNIGYMTKRSFQIAPLTYLFSFFEIVINSVTPFINLLFPKWILDELTGNKNFETVVQYIVLWIGTNLIILLINAAEQIAFSAYTERVSVKEDIHYLRIKAYMDYSRLENAAVQDEEEMIIDNLAICDFASEPWAKVITTFAQFLGYVYIIATLHPFMIAVLLIIVALSSVLSKKQLKIEYEYEAKISKFRRRFKYLFELFSSYQYAKEIRINNAANWIAQKYKSETDQYMKVYSKNLKKKFRIETLGDVIALFQTVILYLYSSYKILRGSISIGSFSMYIGSITAFTGTFISLIRETTRLNNLSQYIDAYRNYVKESVPSHIKKGTEEIDFNNKKHEIEFRNVSFKYPGSENYVLKNISVKIQNGERLSVVGYNGAGKTTLIKLICRLYEPTEGVILYNGKDISKFQYHQYTKLLSVVFQDYNIYSMTLRENVWPLENSDDEKILSALEKSGLSEKVKNLPKGIDTQVGKTFDSDGIEFSGGEQQKIACARAYFKDAPIVILDEPTASLDPISENQLYERFNSIIGSKTAIYISHRLASVKFCNRIIVLVDGRIVENGTHSELMKQEGVYHEMFIKQAGYYTDINDKECTV